MKVKRALVSVFDKSGLDRFVKGLDKLGVELLSTGGTAKFIKGLGLKVTDVSGYTGFPEIMDGRVKTLHPKVHGALLALREKSGHMRQVKEHGIKLIDMVVINLYPFEDVISRKGVKLEEAIENIDIGGPSMLRSAAKNFKDVAVVSSPAMYEEILEALERGDCSLSPDTLIKLARNTFARTSEYDNAIFDFLSRQGANARSLPQEAFSPVVNKTLKKIQDLRYGENPHQQAAFYEDAASKASLRLSSAVKLHGKELSFNNILDLNAALEVIGEFDEPAACIIKHATPCGAAAADDIKTAFAHALECDRLSAFGGIIGVNRPVEWGLAEDIAASGFMECIIAPEYGKGALDILGKKKNFRILKLKMDKAPLNKDDLDIKKVSGGVLLQEKDEKDIDVKDLKVVTKKRPRKEDINGLYFAWKIVKHARSNAIVLCEGKKTVGIGAGQASRVDSVIIALRKAGKKSAGSLLASDAFFPKPDSIEAAAKAGVRSIIQPGGSIADEEIIAAADKAGISMVFTGMRHFKH